MKTAVTARTTGRSSDPDHDERLLHVPAEPADHLERFCTTDLRVEVEVPDNLLEEGDYVRHGEMLQLIRVADEPGHLLLFL